MASTIKLFSGFKRFQQQYFGENRQLYDSMIEGQPAKTMMIACCDSRVDPAIMTDCSPGDLFILRNVANLVPPCEHDNQYHGVSTALEYAVNHLEVENIIIIGHSNCGGIKALWEDDGTGSIQTQFIHRWVSIAQPAKDWVKDTKQDAQEADKLTACEQRSVVQSLTNLMTFDFVRERVNQGTLSLYGWYFDIPTGRLSAFKPEEDSFQAIE